MGGGLGEGGESNLSSIVHVWGRGGKRGGGKSNLSSIDHVWGGEGGGNHDGVICGSNEGGGVG